MGGGRKSFRVNRKEREKRKREMRERGRKEESKERKETGGFFLRSTAFRQSKFVGPKSKVRLRSKRYGFFLLWFIFHSKGCVVVFFALRGCLAKFWNEGMLPGFLHTSRILE